MPQMFPMPTIFLTFMVSFFLFLSLTRIYWRGPDVSHSLFSTFSSKTTMAFNQSW